MKHKILPLSIVALLAVLTVSLFFSWYDDQGKVVSTNFPEKTSHRVVLNPESDQEIIRVSYVNEDEVAVMTEVDYRNGVTSYLFYRADGITLEKVLDFYPEDEEGQVDRRLKAETYFVESGDLLSSHTVYREDGSVLRRGERLNDDSYRTVHLRTDGITVERQRTFDEDQKLVSDLTYFEDGTVQVKTEKVSSGTAYLTTTFREDGTKFSQGKSGYYGSFSGVFFWEDGTTVKAKFEQSSWRLEVEHHDQSGVHEYTVTYTKSGKSVEKINSDGKVVFEQEYDLVGGDREKPVCEGTYVLTKVSEYHKWGQYAYQKKTVKVVEFAEDGVTPVKILVPTTKSLKYIYNLDENGIVESIDETGNQTGRGDGDTVDGSVSFNVGDKVELSPELVDARDFECLQIPERIEITNPNPYYYGGPF